MKGVEPGGRFIGIGSPQYTAVHPIWRVQFKRSVFCSQNIQIASSGSERYDIKCMEQGLSSETDSSSASQDIPINIFIRI
jgi:hypothetical protein